MSLLGLSTAGHFGSAGETTINNYILPFEIELDNDDISVTIDDDSFNIELECE